MKAAGYRVSCIKIGEYYFEPGIRSRARARSLALPPVAIAPPEQTSTPHTAPAADPYLNMDAGTMSPFEHGEVFVLDDGGEARKGS